MHPADVAEFVATAVDELRARIDEHPDLHAGPVELENKIMLYIPFSYEQRRLEQGFRPTGIVVPGGQEAAMGYSVPIIGAPPVERRLVLHLDLTDYDGQPPTAELLHEDRSPLPAKDWPLALGQQVIVRDHRDYKRPFFCRRGLREFHSHPQHQDEPWDKHREGLPLHSIVMELLVLLQDRHSWTA